MREWSSGAFFRAVGGWFVVGGAGLPAGLRQRLGVRVERRALGLRVARGRDGNPGAGPAAWAGARAVAQAGRQVRPGGTARQRRLFGDAARRRYRLTPRPGD